MNVVVSERAATDLEAIQDFVARDNPAAAKRLIQRLVGRLRALEQFARLGKPVAEVPDPTIHELVDGNYRIIYQICDDHVLVLTVFEGHRRWVSIAE